MADDTILLNTKGLDQLIKTLKTNPVVEVGVLGDKNSRASKKGQLTNATVGAAHEFGTSKLPIRSFLRMPITENLEKFLEASGAFTPETLDEVIKSGSIMGWMDKVGIVAEQVIATAFETGGFGKWKPSNMRFKDNWQTLVETQQLRNSISHRVKE